MRNFVVSVGPSNLEVTLNEYREETDIEDLLKFDENQIEDLLCTHASTQSYWEALAVRYRNRYELFSEEFSKKWWAHNKRYARYVNYGYGDMKPTVDAIRDMAILIYSQDTPDLERQKYAHIAYQGVSKSKAEFDGTKEEFTISMFKYLSVDPPWYFENLIQTESRLQENYELVKVIAEKLNSRSFHMQDLLKLIMAKRGNIGLEFERKSHNL